MTAIGQRVSPLPKGWQPTAKVPLFLGTGVVQVGEPLVDAARMIDGLFGLRAVFGGPAPMIVPVRFHRRSIEEQRRNVTDMDQLIEPF